MQPGGHPQAQGPFQDVPDRYIAVLAKRCTEYRVFRADRLMSGIVKDWRSLHWLFLLQGTKKSTSDLF